jgi:hypothetical protein
MTTDMRIYLASSWRNPYQADVLAQLRNAGFDVYDFKNPAPGNTGFAWRNCDPDLRENLNAERMRTVLAHPIAQEGFEYDYNAMLRADACVLLLPSGLSAHLEAGWMSGAGKCVVVLAPEIKEPELMYKLFDGDVRGPTPIYDTVDGVISHLTGWAIIKGRLSEYYKD